MTLRSNFVQSVCGLGCAVVLVLSWSQSASGTVLEETRTIKIMNTTEDVAKVRVHCLHFDGRNVFRDVAKDQDTTVPNALTGERAIIAYDMNGKILAQSKIQLRPGDEPAIIGVFGNATDEYRIDLGNL